MSATIGTWLAAAAPRGPQNTRAPPRGRTLGEDPEAQHGVGDHERHHRDLARGCGSRATEKPQRLDVREHYGDDVSRHDEDHRAVPEDVRAHRAEVDLVAGGAEKIPAEAERVRSERDHELPRRHEKRKVVREMVGDGDGHEREDERARRFTYASILL